MKKFLLGVVLAALAAAVLFLWWMATMELPVTESGSAAPQGFSDVAPFQSRPASETASASSAPAPDAEPVDDLSFLDEEQQAVFARAQEMTACLADPSNLSVQPGNAAGSEVVLDGRGYLLITGQDENYEEFRARMLGIFTEDCLEQLDFDLRFVSMDGRLAALLAGVGGAIDYAQCLDAYRLESADGQTVTFTLIGHYIEQGPQETDTDFITRRARGEFDSTREFTIRLKNTGDGWRVDEFHSPRYPYTF